MVWLLKHYWNAFILISVIWRAFYKIFTIQLSYRWNLGSQRNLLPSWTRWWEFRDLQQPMTNLHAHCWDVLVILKNIKSQFRYCVRTSTLGSGGKKLRTPHFKLLWVEFILWDLIYIVELGVYSRMDFPPPPPNRLWTTLFLSDFCSSQFNLELRPVSVCTVTMMVIPQQSVIK